MSLGLSRKLNRLNLNFTIWSVVFCIKQNNISSMVIWFEVWIQIIKYNLFPAFPVVRSRIIISQLVLIRYYSLICNNALLVSGG